MIKGRREEAIKAIIKSTDMIKARNPSWTPTTTYVGWDEQVFQPIEIFLEELIETFETLYYRITEQETRMYPRFNYGTREQPGWLQIVMSLLDVGRHGNAKIFEKLFLTKITMEKLKSMEAKWDSLLELRDMIRKVNQQLSDESQHNARVQASIQPFLTVKEAFEQVDRRAHDGAPLQRSNTRPFHSTYVKKDTKGRFGQRRLRLMDDDSDGEEDLQESQEEHLNDEDFQNTSDGHPDQQVFPEDSYDILPPKKISQVEDSFNLDYPDFTEEEADEIDVQLKKLMNSKPDPRRQQKPGYGQSLQKSSYSQQHTGGGSYGTPRVQQQYSKKPSATPARQQADMPCFDHFVGKCEKGDKCSYSHSTPAMKRLAEEYAKRLLRSPVAGADWVLDFTRQWRSNKQTFPSSQL